MLGRGGRCADGTRALEGVESKGPRLWAPGKQVTLHSRHPEMGGALAPQCPQGLCWDALGCSNYARASGAEVAGPGGQQWLQYCEDLSGFLLCISCEILQEPYFL